MQFVISLFDIRDQCTRLAWVEPGDFAIVAALAADSNPDVLVGDLDIDELSASSPSQTPFD